MICVCHKCGIKFNGYQKKFCSTLCRNKHLNELRSKKVLPIEKCKKCGREFTKKTNSHVYCSLECRSYNLNIKNEPVIRAKFWIFARDNFKCIYCGKSSIEDGVKLVPEHIFPRWLGGQNTFII